MSFFHILIVMTCDYYDSGKMYRTDKQFIILNALMLLIGCCLLVAGIVNFNTANIGYGIFLTAYELVLFYELRTNKVVFGLAEKHEHFLSYIKIPNERKKLAEK